MEKTIGIDIEDYRNFIEKNHYYIDKTLLIKDFLDDGSEVTLITRPRRFFLVYVQLLKNMSNCLMKIR